MVRAHLISKNTWEIGWLELPRKGEEKGMSFHNCLIIINSLGEHTCPGKLSVMCKYATLIFFLLFTLLSDKNNLG